MMDIFCLFLDIDTPISKGHGPENVDQSKVDTLLSFGFQEDIARKALKASVISSFDIFPISPYDCRIKLGKLF